MASPRKVIITCAPTGAIHTPSMSPHLPVTPREIEEAAIAAAEAGAAILHLHARDPADGRPTQDPAVFAEFLPRIKARTDAVINITTGGSPHMTVAERLRPAHRFQPEVASLNMGSMNFGLYPMLERFREFRHPWEREHLEKSRDLVFKNTFADIETILASCGANGTRFEFECYDISHLYNLAHFVERGLAKPPFFVQSVFGLLGGIGAHPEDLAHMRRTADRLFGADYVVDSRRGQAPDSARDDRRGPGRERTRRPRGFVVDRPRPARRIERRAGTQDSSGTRRIVARDRDTRRRARDARAQGRRRGQLLNAHRPTIRHASADTRHRRTPLPGRPPFAPLPASAAGARPAHLPVIC